MMQQRRSMVLRALIAGSWLLAWMGVQPLSAHATGTTATGLLVSFTAGGPCSVGPSSLGPNGTSTATVTITGAGQCAITASQPGDGTYAAATDVVQSFMVARAPTSISLSSIADTPYHDPVALSATVSPASIGPQALAGTVIFSIDGAPVGSAPVNSSGIASVSPTVTQDAGKHSVTASFTSTNSNFADSSTTSASSFSVTPEDTTLTYVDDSSADFHDSPTFKAKLLEDGDATKPLAGKDVAFTLGTQTCGGKTGTDGVASCSLTINAAPGSVSNVSAAFAGDTNDTSSATGNAPFAIKKEETSVRYTGPTQFPVGSSATVSATLSEDGSTALSGKSVRITIGAGNSSKSCTGSTSNLGAASCTLGPLPSTAGQYPITVSFDGDTNYLPAASPAQPAILFAFPARGAFVIGDTTAAAGLNRTVSFWGTQWSSQNQLSGGPAPSSFFGFARTLVRTPPICGTVWSTTPGASSLQPPVNVPTYMAVIVAGKISKSGASIVGDTRAIGIVHTAGGSAGPGTLGTGALLATFCPSVSKALQHVTRGHVTHAYPGHGPSAAASTPPHAGSQHPHASVHPAQPRGPFRFAPVRPLHAGGLSSVLPVTRLAQGYAPTRSARVTRASHHLRGRVTGTKSQQIQFGTLSDKTFGDAPFQISASSVTQPVNPGGVPPDPSTVASPIDGTVVTTIGANTSFLYTGDNPIQTGVAPGTISPIRAAVLKGKVLDSSGNPISGVTVAILNHPEFGQTLSRADGAFDLAVNGGGQLTVTYSKQGYLPAQRQIDAPWQDYASLPDVVLLQNDPNVATIDLASSAPIQVAQGSVESDADGSRQATLFFQQGTTATMTLPGGGTQPLSTMHVRATEYTVGANGPAAMPGDLPPTSGYTYAAEYSVDEAQAAGATGVQFSRPVISYTENFLNFPVGMIVPQGRYDATTGEWIPEPNGRVIKILSITNGMADLDIDGSGTAAGGPALGALGISDAERTQLAALHPAGTSLWRTPLNHFSSWDSNWPYGPNGCSGLQCVPRNRNPQANNDPKNQTDPCKKSGSIIGCLGQSLGEDVPVTGTSFSLHYESARLGSRTDAFTVPIPLTDGSPPGGLVSVELQLTVAGRQIVQSFPGGPNLTYTFIWDGKDAYGRLVQGVQKLSVRIGYTYQAVYQTPDQHAQAFAGTSGVPISANKARQQITFWQTFDTQIGTWRANLEGLGGWSLDVHDAYDPVSRILYYGDGTTRGADLLTYNGDVAAVAGGNQLSCNTALNPTCGDGGPASSAPINSPAGIAVDAQGAEYIAQQGGNSIRRIGPDGIISTVAGIKTACSDSTAPCGDGGPATQAQLNSPADVAVGPDGSLYIADEFDQRVRKVDPSGTIQTIAGTGVYGFSGDGGLATQATFKHPVSVAVGPDGSVYILDSGTLTIRKIAPNGIITTVAGTGTGCVNGLDENVADGTPATSGPLCVARGLAIAPDGSIIFAQDNGSQLEKVRKIGTDGIIQTIAGTGPICRNTPTDSCGDGGPATQAGLSGPTDVAVAADGTVYIADGGNSHERVRHIRADGSMESVASGGSFGSPPVAPAGAADLYTIDGIAAVPDGSIDVALHDRRQVLHIAPTLPGLGVGDQALPSADGTQLYVFDSQGRHLRTLDAIAGALKYSFTYDSGNRLTSIIDADGNTTLIQHDGYGNPAAIIAPGGEITTLTTDGHGYINSIADQLGNTYDLTSDADGLMRTLRDPNGNLHSFNYDAAGLLTEDDNPVGGSTTLVRTTNGPDDYSVAATTALGRTTTYTMKQSGAGETISTTSPAGATTSITIAGNTTAETYPDGTTVAVTLTADPRWGMMVPVASNVTETTLGGVTSTLSETRTAALSTPSNPLSLTSLTDAVTVNGHTYTGTYTASSRRYATSTPTGETSFTYVDSKDHVTEVDLPDGADPITAVYNAKGDPVTVQQGSRSLTFSYDGRERLSDTQDAAGNITQYGYDSADRITSITLPNGEIYRQDYDRNGNVTALTMPSGAQHLLDSTAVDQISRYTPPGNTGAYTFDYNKDGDLLHSYLPGGRSEAYGYDTTGRLTSANYPEEQNLFSYSGPTELVTNILHTSPSDTQVEALNIGYDGSLPTSMQVQGTTSAQYGYTFNPDQLLAGIALSSGNDTATTSITRNADSLITGYGPFTIDRNGPDGRPSGIHDGTLAMSLGYDRDGRVNARSQTVNGVSAYSVALSYNGAGLISRKVETIAGTSHTYDYTYNPDGALTLVKQDSQNAEQYAYDVNGNRTSSIVGLNATQTATYDVEDRLTKLGNTTYSFNGDGFLQSRGSDSFTYDTHGELLSATVGGTTATYTYDGIGRRIAETTPAGTVLYYYGNPDDPYQVTEARDTSGTLTRLFYDEGGLLYAMQRGNSRYYVATDQVGTPRVVTDSTGAIVRQLTYDSYGNLTADSNSGFFLPIGFAGGIADATTGFVHFGFRDYDPAAGRWVERDPSLYNGGQGNLYAYVGDSPVGLRDPTGLFCMGGSSYEGIGGGADYCISTKGISVCAELGFGTGGSINVNPFGDPMQNYFGVQAEASAGSKGVFGVFADTGWNAYDISGDCLGIQGNAGVEGASHQLKLWNLQKGFKPDYKKTKLPWDNDKANEKLGKLGVSAKLVVKVCQNAYW